MGQFMIQAGSICEQWIFYLLFVNYLIVYSDLIWLIWILKSDLICRIIDVNSDLIGLSL